MKAKLLRLAGVGLSLWTTGCGSGAIGPSGSPIDVSNLKEAWDANNDPRRLSGTFEIRLNRLPLSATVDRKPWTDTYWPSYRGGLASRWQEPMTDPYNYELKDLAGLQALDASAMVRLSPAEKYDIFVGRYDYPLVTEERSRTKPDEETWHGLCHGWAPAAINFAEPKPVTLTGAGGVKVSFGSSDVKALLTFVQQYNRTAPDSRLLGARCNSDLATDSGHAGDPECKDVNAGSFHIVITNQLGLLKQAFVADVTRDEQVWNQPVYGFKSQILGDVTPIYASAAPGTARVVKVQTQMEYIAEYGPSWKSVPFDQVPAQRATETYQYTLELNAAGEIIGGEWQEYKRPDFLWTQKTPQFKDYFQGVDAIYKASIAATGEEE